MPMRVQRRLGGYDHLIVTGLTARAPAKLNLQLSVGPLGSDGYHDLATIFHAVSLFDEVTVRPAGRITVRVEGADAELVPAGSANLAVKAAAALRKAAGVTGGVEISIRKRIPVAAGLAGGSADAAAALVACNKLWSAGLSPAVLAGLAAGLGSDVPFALAGGTAVGLGRGERLTPALVSGRYHWVLAVASDGLSTPAVYAECDRLRAAAAGAHRPVEGRAPAISNALLAALRSGDAAAVGALLDNDLQPAALSLRHPLRRALEAGHERGALGCVVAGSGPTCAFLARSAEHALDLAAALTGAGVCRHVVSASGPVPGATVIREPAGRPGAT
jgi:4-diphosphocytidyl-2-C-methyl-D-erythritol kinase